MILGRVIGTVTSTIEHPDYQGHRLLVVEKIDEKRNPTGAVVLAMDHAGTGVGEDVLVLDEGNGARQVLGSKTAPVRTLIVGHLDSVDLADDSGK